MPTTYSNRYMLPARQAHGNSRITLATNNFLGNPPHTIPSDPDNKVYDLTDSILKGQWHEVQVFATNGRPYHFTQREWINILKSKRFLFAVTVVVGVLVLVKPEEFESSLPMWFRIVLWGGIILLYAALTYFVGNSFLSLFRKFKIRIFPTVVMHALILPVLTYIGYLSASLYAGDPEILNALTVVDVLRNLFFVLLFEAYVASFIGPQVVGMQPRQGTDPKFSIHSNPPKVTIGEQVYNPDTFFFVQSAGHYLEIHFHAKSEFVRMSMANFTKQIREVDGIQTHRSYWVSSNAVSLFERRNGRGFVRLTDGTEIPVSRGRSKAVKEWVTKHKKTPGH